MARKPINVSWLGFTAVQSQMLEFLDFVGDDGWARTGLTAGLMPQLLAEFADERVPLARVKLAMRSVGYGAEALQRLDRWDTERTTGPSGRRHLR